MRVTKFLRIRVLATGRNRLWARGRSWYGVSLIGGTSCASTWYLHISSDFFPLVSYLYRIRCFFTWEYAIWNIFEPFCFSNDFFGIVYTLNVSSDYRQSFQERIIIIKSILSQLQTNLREGNGFLEFIISSKKISTLIIPKSGLLFTQNRLAFVNFIYWGINRCWLNPNN